MTEKATDADIEFIEALATVLKDNDLAEIEVQRGVGKENNLNVRISRQSTVAPVMAAPVMAAPVVAAQAAPPATAPTAPSVATDAQAPPPVEDPAQHPGAVTSPMVGMAYLQPEPGAAPYVNIGDNVGEGQTLLIVEAMKTLNQITAQKSGRVTRILVEDSTPVEFGTPLMIIE